MNPHDVTKQFEKELCEYTGAPYAVTVTSCTAALMLSVKWFLKNRQDGDMRVEIPKRTYVSVPQSIIHAGGRPVFRDEDWIGAYQLSPLPVWDSARFFSSGMCVGVDSYSQPWMPFRNMAGQFVCVSFHWTKILGIGQGGAILHDNPEADEWLRRARFDGRKEGVAPKDDTFTMVAHHCYMSPRDAAEGLSRLAILPRHNDPLPNDDYPDLSQIEVFR